MTKIADSLNKPIRAKSYTYDEDYFAARGIEAAIIKLAPAKRETITGKLPHYLKDAARKRPPVFSIMKNKPGPQADFDG